MNNYNTRKHLFEYNFKNNKENNNEEFRLSHTKFKVMSQTSDHKNINLEATSKSSKCKCPHCNTSTSSIKDRKIVYPLVGTYNGKAIIMKYTKFRFYCYNCKKSFVEETPDVKRNKQISNTILTLIYNELCDKVNYTKTSTRVGLSVSTVIRYLDNINLNNIRHSKVKNILIDELRLISYSSKNKILWWAIT